MRRDIGVSRRADIRFSGVRFVVINGETIVRRKEIAAGFPSETPSGAVSPAEFERIDIIGGKGDLTPFVRLNGN